MTVTASYEFKVSVQEILDLGLDYPTAISLNWTLPAKAAKLVATSTPPVTMAFSDEIVLTAGPDTVDLMALVRGATLPNLDMDTEDVVMLVVELDAAAVGPATFEPGATNGYEFAGATGELILQPGDRVMMLLNNAPAVSATTKDLDISGTSGDLFRILVVAGS